MNRKHTIPPTNTPPTEENRRGLQKQYQNLHAPQNQDWSNSWSGFSLATIPGKDPPKKKKKIKRL